MFYLSFIFLFFLMNNQFSFSITTELKHPQMCIVHTQCKSPAIFNLTLALLPQYECMSNLSRAQYTTQSSFLFRRTQSSLGQLST